MRNSLKGLSLVLSLVFGSCTAKEKPIVKEEFKERFIPLPMNEELEELKIEAEKIGDIEIILL